MGRLKHVERSIRRTLGCNSAGRMTPTGRIDLPKTLRTHKEDDDRDYLGSLQVVADSSCEPLERLCALEDAVANGVDEARARQILGMYQ